MAHYFRWLVPEKVIYFRIVNVIEPHEVTPIDVQMHQFLDEASSDKVHVLIDTTLMTTPPNIPTTMRLTYLRHSKLGHVVTNQRSGIESFIFNTVGKVLKIPHRFVKTVEDCPVYLASVDDSLPPLDDMLQRLKIIQAETHAEHKQV